MKGRIFDAHFHIYRAADVPAEGLMSAPTLRRDFSWSDFERAWEGLTVEGAAFVQVRPEEQGLAEAETLAEFQDHVPLAGFGSKTGLRAHPESGFGSKSGVLQAVVAGCVVENPRRRRDLAALARLPLVRAVRRGTQFHPDPLYLARPEMIAGYRRVGELGLAGQVCVKHFQLEAVHRLATALPELTLILDHLGKPPLSEPPPAGWREWMGRLAELPNVVVKVAPSPQTPADPPLDRDAAAAAVRETVDLFGFDRCLYGSNWPVSTLLTGYREWIEIVCSALPGAGPEELDALFFRTAAGLLRASAPGA